MLVAALKTGYVAVTSLERLCSFTFQLSEALRVLVLRCLEYSFDRE